jgi:hypothetical protein
MTTAKEKDDKKVIMALKNVVTDPKKEQADDTVEPTPEDMMADLMESGEIDENDFFDIDYFDTTDTKGETEFDTDLTKVVM